MRVGTVGTEHCCLGTHYKITSRDHQDTNDISDRNQIVFNSYFHMSSAVRSLFRYEAEI
jgi:hypothetical protein